MKVDLEHISSPCMMCYIHGNGKGYDPDYCANCEFNIAICLLRNVLEIEDGAKIDWKTEFSKHYIGEK